MKKVTLKHQWLFVITLALAVIYSCNDSGPEDSEPPPPTDTLIIIDTTNQDH